MEEYTQLSFDFMTGFEDTGKFVGKVGIFKTKKCSKCSIEFEATRENFGIDKLNKNKLKSWCKNCYSKNTKEITKKRVKEGIFCKSCNNFKLPNSLRCTYHHVQGLINSQINIGRFKQLKTTEQKRFYIEKLIEKLETQNYKCAITGVPIELGKNASIDHIQEVSQGGACTLENLQWVDRTVNFSKARKYKNY